MIPPKYVSRAGSWRIPQHPPGRRDGESNADHAARLYAMGYTLADVRTLADAPEWVPAE